MAKTRLNKRKREVLINLAQEKIALHESNSNLLQAQADMRVALIDYMKTIFSPSERKTLLKFGCIMKSKQFQLVAKSPTDDSDIFQDCIVDAELETCRYSSGSLYYWRTIIVDDFDCQLHKLILRVNEFQMEYSRHQSSTKRDYENMIESATTYEQILDIWPEANEVRHLICEESKALSLLTPELAERIKQDAKTRTKKEK